jgi:hypothetical protein
MKSKRFERADRIQESIMMDTYHDAIPDSISPPDYSNDLLRRNTSKVLWANKRLSSFLLGISDSLVYMFDAVSYIRNQRNYTVKKYYNGYLD